MRTICLKYRRSKMYKSRIQTWGLDKKLKEHEARAIIYMIAYHRGQASHVRLRGRRVEIKAVEAHLRRKQIAIGDVLSTGAPHVSNLIICETPGRSERGVPRCLESPDAFKTAEVLCADVREYILSSFGTSRWLPQNLNEYCDFEGIVYTAQCLVQDFLDMLAACWYEPIFHPGIEIKEDLEITEGVREASAKFMDPIKSRSFENLPLMIQLMAAVLVWPLRPLASTLCKNICFILATHDFGDSHVNMYLHRIFIRIGHLASSDEILGYLLAVTRSSVDSYEHVLGQYHPQTVSVTVILSQIMCILYGPDGLSGPLEALLSSLESQQGPGTRQSILLRSEMRRLGELRDVSEGLQGPLFV